MICIKCKVSGFLIYAYFIFLTKKLRFLCVTLLLEFFVLLLPVYLLFLALVLVCGCYHYYMYLARLGLLFLSVMSGYATASCLTSNSVIPCILV